MRALPRPFTSARTGVVREEKRVSWPDRRKDKRGMTGISELYTPARGEGGYLSLLLSSETVPLLHASAR